MATTEEAKQTAVARLKKITLEIADTQKTLDIGKRYFPAHSLYTLKSGEHWADDHYIMVESPLGEQDRISLSRILKRLSEERALLQYELAEAEDESGDTGLRSDEDEE